MSRRKHLLQSLEQEVEPPGEGQHIVRALGSRGSNIIEVRHEGWAAGWRSMAEPSAADGATCPLPTARS